MFVEACLEFNLIQNTPETGTCATQAHVRKGMYLTFPPFVSFSPSSID